MQASALISISCGPAALITPKAPSTTSNPQTHLRSLKPSEEFSIFWKRLQTALRSGDVDRVSELVCIPSVDGGDPKTTKEFREEFGEYFPPDMITAVLHSSAESVHRLTQKELIGRDFSPSSGPMWQFEWRNGLTSEGQLTIHLLIGRSTGKMRILTIWRAG